jgi:glucokinase
MAVMGGALITDTRTVKVVVALDIGGTLLKGGLVELDGTLLHAVTVPTEAQDGPEMVVKRVEGLLLDLAGEARSRGAEALIAGVAVPGLVDEARGRVHLAGNLGWRDLELAPRLESALGIPVTLHHDVRAAALAEARLGAGRGEPDFLFVNLGTGVSAALVLGGRPRAGAHGRAGELGHVLVDEDGSPCTCGSRGCLETMSSASSLVRRYAERSIPGASLSGLDAIDVLRKAAEGNAVATAVRDDALTALGAVLIATQSLLDLNLVVVGGGMALAGDSLLQPLGARLARDCRTTVPPRLVTSMLGPEAGLVGAGLAAWERFDTSGQKAPPRPLPPGKPLDKADAPQWC